MGVAGQFTPIPARETIFQKGPSQRRFVRVLLQLQRDRRRARHHGLNRFLSHAPHVFEIADVLWTPVHVVANGTVEKHQ